VVDFVTNVKHMDNNTSSANSLLHFIIHLYKPIRPVKRRVFFFLPKKGNNFHHHSEAEQIKAGSPESQYQSGQELQARKYVL
jgi:hypothetical protein